MLGGDTPLHLLDDHFRLSLRQVFVKFNAAFKKGEMVSSQNFYVLTRKEKLNATWIP